MDDADFYSDVDVHVNISTWGEHGVHTKATGFVDVHIRMNICAPPGALLL